MRLGVKAIAISAALYGIISMFANILPNKKLVGYTITEQMKDILPPFFVSIIMGAIVYACSFIELSTVIVLFIQIAVGAGVYVGISYIFKLEAFSYLTGMLSKMIKVQRRS